jgi:hypothetical protein
MNADDVFRFGHLSLMECLEALPADQWERAGISGEWSTKDILSHLASYEIVVTEVFGNVLDERPTSTLDQLLAQPEEFNRTQAEQRRDRSGEEILEEYRAAHEQAAGLLAQIPVERRRQSGLLPWYGAEYDLEDLIVYMSYGHKREHGAQIAEFCDRVAKTREG